jgi:signal transduction histidine kinase
VPPGQDGTTERWRRWRFERNRRGLRIGLLIMATLYPAFGVVDWLAAEPPLLYALWATRAVIAAATLAVWLGMRTAFFERHADLVAAGYVVLGAAGVCAMMPLLGGLASPYYAGVNLMMLAAGLLFVWPRRVVVATYSGIVGVYLLVNGVAGAVGPLATALSNLAFLLTTAIVSATGQLLHHRTLRDQHAQRLQLEHATEKLEHANAALQQLDLFKSRFFANMTHELRTPLAMVLTPLELLMQGEMGQFTEAQRSSFVTMFRSALKLLKLVNDLLDLSRLEESRLRLEVAAHDLDPYLRGLTEETQVLARRKAVELAYRAEPGPRGAVVWCDLERLERVFVNLLSNAIKFTPPGGHVTVSLAGREDEVEVEVRDDGSGFPPETAARLFERFYQVDMAGTRQHGGAGIGLALAKEIVQLHGGTIEARSDGRHGATLTVRLRRDAAYPGAGAAKPATPATQPEGDPGQDWAVQLAARRDFRLLDIEEAAERRVVERDPDEGARPYTVVVVEDSPQITQFIHMTLRRQFRVLIAPDGLKGLEVVERERPDLVVTDLMMPGLDGLAMTRRLREDPRTRHIPIIMLTARGELDDRVRGLETGVSLYLTKPFSPRELLTGARRLVQAKEEAAELVLTQRMDSLELVAAGLAHELNNPLNYVKHALGRVQQDMAQVLALSGQAADGALPQAGQEQLARTGARLREFLGVADAGLRRMAGTVELMGRYGRAGYRRELTLFDAWEAVRTAVAVVLPATGRDVKVELDLEGDGTMECVPEELGQVVTNLLQNAIEAVADGTGQVRLLGRGGAADLVLQVRDNGPGIPPEALSRLFTPFFTTKGPGRGTGLGLTISRRVVDALGGTLRASSTPGQGAEFTVRLPRRQPASGRGPA